MTIKTKSKKVAGTKAKKAGKSGKPQMPRAEGEKCFWVNDGTIISDLVGLSEALQTMAAEVFAHHVTRDKNDFADWVEWVLGDAELAKTLRKSKQPKTARVSVVKRLKVYDI